MSRSSAAAEPCHSTSDYEEKDFHVSNVQSCDLIPTLTQGNNFLAISLHCHTFSKTKAIPIGVIRLLWPFFISPLPKNEIKHLN
jgi:hypothetical protein